jgi:hypothetical protein
MCWSDSKRAARRNPSLCRCEIMGSGSRKLTSHVAVSTLALWRLPRPTQRETSRRRLGGFPGHAHSPRCCPRRAGVCRQAGRKQLRSLIQGSYAPRRGWTGMPNEREDHRAHCLYGNMDRRAVFPASGRRSLCTSQKSVRALVRPISAHAVVHHKLQTHQGLRDASLIKRRSALSEERRAPTNFIITRVLDSSHPARRRTFETDSHNRCSGSMNA